MEVHQTIKSTFRAFISIVLPLYVEAQSTVGDRIYLLEDSNYMYFISPKTCKETILFKAIKDKLVTVQISPSPLEINPGSVSEPRQRLFHVDGNLVYDFNYRSYIDTPVSLTNFQQHFVQTNLRVLYANTYPIDIVLRTRQSNNRYFRNYADVNIYFNGSLFRDIAKQKLLKAVNTQYGQQDLKNAEHYFHTSASNLLALQEWIRNEQNMNRYFEYKDLLQRIPNTIPNTASSISPDAIIFPNSRRKWLLAKDEMSFENEVPSGFDNIDIQSIKSFVSRFESKQDSLLKLTQQTEKARLLMEETKSKITNEVKEIKNRINSAASYDEMKQLSRTLGMKIDSGNRFARTLYSLQSFGIGRSFLDYSELTVKNVSINGVHAEFKQRKYYAFAAGVVDYRFRDFVFTQPITKPQTIALFRYGSVSKNGNNIIFTGYTGRKQNYGFLDSANSFASIFGFSIESKLQLNKTTFITAEIAKSSYGGTPGFRTGTAVKREFSLSDESTLAYFVSLQSTFQKTRTKIRAQYRYQGAYFQSFTLYYSQNNVTAWSAFIDQMFLKNKLQVQASVRKNEFSNPYLPFGYRSDVVFASAQASLRLKRLPFFMVAYMPSVQVMLLDNKITETRYYSLIGSASHFYSIGKTQATALLLVSRFFNSQSDSGFVYYNARNIQATHTILGKLFSVNSSFSYNNGVNDKLYVYEQGLQYRNNSLSVGGGIKYNDLNHYLFKTGYYSSLTFGVQKIKTDFNFSFEHGFLPGFNHTLITNDFGRITILKRLK